MFTSKPDKPLPIKNVVLDGAGNFEVDEEYISLGVDEGWLMETGYYELNGILYYTWLYLG